VLLEEKRFHLAFSSVDALGEFEKGGVLISSRGGAGGEKWGTDVPPVEKEEGGLWREGRGDF